MHALVLQCGGPTAVVNVSLAALVRRWRSSAPSFTLHGGHDATRALVSRDWRALSGVDEEWLATIEATPGMALGGGRERLTADEVDAAVTLLGANGVGTLFLIGGNGTMAAGRALSARAAAGGVPLRVIGVPKTVDNDIPATDVCPGFPSAGRFLLNAVRDIAIDAGSMRGYEDVVLIETMGRHAGWLATATALARSGEGDAPHLVLVPERPFDEAAFLDGVRAQHARAGLCVVTVAEGVRDPAGALLAERAADAGVERDASGQVILGRTGGPLPYLASLVRDRLGLRCRLVRPDVLQRCSRAHVSETDRALAALVGRAAVDVALSADVAAAVMVGLRRSVSGWSTALVPLDAVRGERTVPPEILAEPWVLWDVLF